jgi:outer membrane autotransporter protein
LTQFAATNAFVERINSCPRVENGGRFQREHGCMWGRTIANSAEQGASTTSVGYRQSSQAFQFSGKKEVAPDWFLGACVGSAQQQHASQSTHAFSGASTASSRSPQT